MPKLNFPAYQLKEFTFPNYDQAYGFAKGVEWVNDSAITFIELEESEDGWVAYFRDRDASDS